MQDVVLFGSPSHVTMMLKVDPHAERVGAGILIKESSIKVIDARQTLTDRSMAEKKHTLFHFFQKSNDVLLWQQSGLHRTQL